MNKKIIVELTTFCGRCIEAIHYYVSVEYYDSCDDFRRDKLKRPITQKEIDSNGDRFYSYEAGEPTECFNSWREALESAQEYISFNGLEGDIYVYGVPNKGTLTLEQALDPELDTRKRCSKCGKVFGDREGLYNFPEGALCVQCHKNNQIMQIEQDRHCSLCKYYQCVNFFMYCTKLQHRIKASRKNGCDYFEKN